MIGIYCIRNTLNNKVYIGQTINLKKREKQHFNLLKQNKHDNLYLQCAYNLHGVNNFVFEIIDTLMDNEDITQCEQDWIDSFIINGYELYNLRHIAKSNAGMKLSDETKQKMSLAARGISKSKTHKENISKGKKGVIFSQEHKDKIGRSRYKSVVQLDKNTEEVIKIWPSPLIAAKELNIARTSIVKVCTGAIKSAGGYKWRHNSEC